MKTKVIALVVALFATSPALAAEYTVDAKHTSVGFKVGHLGLSSVLGRFGEFEGSFQFGPKKIAEATANANITVSSVDTDDKKRDDHLRSADFFDAGKHPDITFATKKITDVSGKTFKVHGDLSIRGVTKPVVLNATYKGAAKDPWGNDRVAFSAEGTLNRKDFGITWNKFLDSGGLLVGNEVTIMLEVQGIKKS